MDDFVFVDRASLFANEVSRNAGYRELETHVYPFSVTGGDVKTPVKQAVLSALEHRQRRGVAQGKLFVLMEQNAAETHAGIVVDVIDRGTSPAAGGKTEIHSAESPELPTGEVTVRKKDRPKDQPRETATAPSP
jgi:hypothetical protein